MGDERFVGDQGALFDEGAENRSLPRRPTRSLGPRAIQFAERPYTDTDQQLDINLAKQDSPQAAAA